MFAGMSFGLAESSSSIISGIVCKYLKDQHAYTGFCILSLISMSVFYFVGGGESGSILSLVSIYGTMLGVGSNINIVYIMIE